MTPGPWPSFPLSTMFCNLSRIKPKFWAICMELRQVLHFVYCCLTLYSIDTHFKASTIDNFLKTLWEKKKLLVTSNFFFFHIVFYSIRKLYPYWSIFLTVYLYLLLKWKSQKLAYEVKGQHFPKQALVFTCLQYKSFENSWKKRNGS